MQERNRLFEYPLERLFDNIKKVRFRCTCCAKCCTRVVNRHVFLLDRDVTGIKTIDPAALEPAPDPEFCDQNGTFYVSGYALRTKDDTPGTCWFLEKDRCRIYDRRSSICRIYPFMLRRNTGSGATAYWRLVSRQNEHGEYQRDVPDEEALALAREVKEYENGFLTQQISFLELIHEYFIEHQLHHAQNVYEDQMRRFFHGEPVTIMAYYAGRLEEHRLTKSIRLFS